MVTFGRAKPGKITVNLTAIQSIFEPGGGVHRNGTEMGREMRDVAVRSVAGATKTGALARGYRNATSPTYLGCFVTLYTTVKHGAWYEAGTAGEGMGYIYPKRGKTLKIGIAGSGLTARTTQQAKTGFIHARRVRGQRPKHTMENAMRIVLISRGLL